MMWIQNIGWKSIGKILLMMFLLTAAALLVFAFLAQKFIHTNQGIAIGISVIYVLSCLAGGFFAGKVKKRKKFIWGMFMGMAYGVILLVMSLIVLTGKERTVGEIVINLALCTFGGMFGGMIS